MEHKSDRTFPYSFAYYDSTKHELQMSKFILLSGVFNLNSSNSSEVSQVHKQLITLFDLSQVLSGYRYLVFLY